MKPGSGLYIVSPGSPDQKLLPYKGLKFRVQEFADVVVESAMLDAVRNSLSD